LLLSAACAEAKVEEAPKEPKKKELDEALLTSLAAFIAADTDSLTLPKLVDTFYEKAGGVVFKQSVRAPVLPLSAVSCRAHRGSCAAQVRNAIQEYAFRARGRWHVKPEYAPRFGVPVVDIPVPKRVTPKPSPPESSLASVPVAAESSPTASSPDHLRPRGDSSSSSSSADDEPSRR
jgi:hypothetical protein